MREEDMECLRFSLILRPKATNITNRMKPVLRMKPEVRTDFVAGIRESDVIRPPIVQLVPRNVRTLFSLRHLLIDKRKR